MDEKKNQKNIALSQLTFGLLILGFWVYSLSDYIKFLIKMFGKDNISYLKIFYRYHLIFFISILTVSSAILSLKNNIYGWLLSIASWLLIVVTFAVALFRSNFMEEIFKNLEFGLITLFTIIALFITIYLFLKFRGNYNLKPKHYLLFGVVTIILLVDKIFLL